MPWVPMGEGHGKPPRAHAERETGVCVPRCLNSPARQLAGISTLAWGDTKPFKAFISPWRSSNRFSIFFLGRLRPPRSPLQVGCCRSLRKPDWNS